MSIYPATSPTPKNVYILPVCQEVTARSLSKDDLTDTAKLSEFQKNLKADAKIASYRWKLLLRKNRKREKRTALLYSVPDPDAKLEFLHMPFSAIRWYYRLPLKRFYTGTYFSDVSSVALQALEMLTGRIYSADDVEYKDVGTEFAAFLPFLFYDEKKKANISSSFVQYKDNLFVFVWVPYKHVHDIGSSVLWDIMTRWDLKWVDVEEVAAQGDQAGRESLVDTIIETHWKSVVEYLVKQKQSYENALNKVERTNLQSETRPEHPWYQYDRVEFSDQDVTTGWMSPTFYNPFKLGALDYNTVLEYARFRKCDEWNEKTGWVLNVDEYNTCQNENIQKMFAAYVASFQADGRNRDGHKLREKLMATGDKILVYKSTDELLGSGKLQGKDAYKGQNHVGLMLMHIRMLYQSGTFIQDKPYKEWDKQRKYGSTARSIQQENRGKRRWAPRRFLSWIAQLYQNSK